MAISVKAKEEIQETPSAVSAWREQIPATGLREYWYPALHARKVGKRRPVGVRILGEDIVLFRARNGAIAGLQDLCAHRGSKLSGGVCHFPGTVSCPYHGWTYDANGKCVATLVEGPDSHIPKTKVQVPVKQVRELRGIIWVWMGEGEPVPLEEDVPEELLDPHYLIFTAIRVWPINWRLLVENAIDGHAPYVHRNSLLMLLYGMPPLGQKLTPISTREGKGIALLKGPAPPLQQNYPGLGRFPKRLWRKYWTWIFPNMRKRGTFTGKPYTQEVVLPGMVRIDYGAHLYVRWGVPVDETSVRNFYWHIYKGSALTKARCFVRYHLFRRWAMNSNFSEQDRKVIGLQDYSKPEKLSWTDQVIIQLRQLILQGYHAERVSRTHRETFG